MLHFKISNTLFWKFSCDLELGSKTCKSEPRRWLLLGLSTRRVRFRFFRQHAFLCTSLLEYPCYLGIGSKAIKGVWALKFQGRDAILEPIAGFLFSPWFLIKQEHCRKPKQVKYRLCTWLVVLGLVLGVVLGRFGFWMEYHKHQSPSS